MMSRNSKGSWKSLKPHGNTKVFCITIVYDFDYQRFIH